MTIKPGETTPEAERNLDPKKGEHSDAINSPSLDEKGKPTLRAISNEKQAFAIAKGLKEQSKERNKRNAVILDKYNGEAPFSAAELAAVSQLWRNNFSTNPLANIVDRVKPQFPDAMQRAKTLTNSQLPTLVPDAKKKSKVFQTEITTTIRAWPQYGDFISGLSQEEVLFGGAAPIHLDRNDWRPALFRCDRIFFPEGTGQHASGVQQFMVEQEMLIHEFVDLFYENPEAAKKNGYNIENCIEIANKEIEQSDENSEMAESDKVRENFYSASYGAKQKTITLFHVVVREYTGGVDLWTVDSKEGKLVRKYETLYEDDMAEAVTLFTLQAGNRKYYGSKGLGRLLVNLHISIDRGRNLAQDQVYLSGLVILQADEKDKNSINPVVRHPFVILPKSVNIAKEQIQFDATGYLALDQKLNELAEATAGSFIPPNIQNTGNTRTKIEAAQKVEREERVKQGVLQRFNMHASDLVGTMQRKICSPLNLREAYRVWEDRKDKRQGAFMVVTKKVMKLLKRAFSTQQRELQAVEAYESAIADCEAVECIVAMLEKGLSPEEIAMLAIAPTNDNLAQESQENDNNTLAFLQQAAGNPYIDAKEATRMAGELMAGDDRMERLMIQDEDQTVEAEATRLQITEFHDMMDGEMVPVSPRDNHRIHRKVLYPKLLPIMAALDNPGTLTPEILKTAKLCALHAQAHADLDPAAKQNPELGKQEQEQLKKIFNGIEQAEQMLAQQQAQLGRPDAQNMPPPVPGAPLQAGGPGGGIVGEGGANIEALTAAGKLAMDMEDRRLRGEEIKLKAEDQRHRHGMDRAKAVLDVHSVVDKERDTALFYAAQEEDRRTAAASTDAVIAKEEAARVAEADKQAELNKV